MKREVRCFRGPFAPRDCYRSNLGSGLLAESVRHANKARYIWEGCNNFGGTDRVPAHNGNIGNVIEATTCLIALGVNLLEKVPKLYSPILSDATDASKVLKR